MRSWWNTIWLLKSDLKQFFQNRIWKYTDVGLPTFNMLANDKEILMEVWKVDKSFQENFANWNKELTRILRTSISKDFNLRKRNNKTETARQENYTALGHHLNIYLSVEEKKG